MKCNMQGNMNFSHPILDFLGEAVKGMSPEVLKECLVNFAALDSNLLKVLNAEMVQTLISGVTPPGEPKPCSEPTSEPTSESSPESTSESDKLDPESASESAPEPASEPASEPAPKPAPKSAPKSAPKLTPESEDEPDVCFVPSCNEPFYSKGMCRKHYQSHRLQAKKGSESEKKWLNKYNVTKQDIERGQNQNKKKKQVKKEKSLTPSSIKKSVKKASQAEGDDDSPKEHVGESTQTPVSICLADCGRKAHSRGLCSAHYQQYREAVKKGKEKEFFAQYNIGELPRGKKGRRSKNKEPEVVAPTINIELKRDLRKFKNKKELKLTSVNLSELIEILGSELQENPLDQNYWQWSSVGEGRVKLDLEENSLFFFSEISPPWEAQLYEKNFILDLVEKFNLRYIKVDDEKVIVSKFKNCYLLPEFPDERFTVRAKKGWNADAYWEPGDVFYIDKFKYDGLVIDKISVWLKKPPCWKPPCEDDPVREEWEHAEQNLRLIEPAEKVKEFFYIEFDGIKPRGAHPELIGLDD